MIFRTTQEKINEYRETPALNISRAKLLLQSVHLFNEKDEKEAELYYEEKEHFILGDAADTLITMGREAFEGKFHVSAIKNKPGEKAMAIVHQVFDAVKDAMMEEEEVRELRFAENRLLIYQACDDNEYYMNARKEDWEEDNRWSRLMGNPENTAMIEEYWSDLKNALGKQVLTSQQADKVFTAVASWLSCPEIRDLITDNEDVDIIFQMPLYFFLISHPCKGLLDIVRIDKNKKLISFCDFKLIGDPTFRFPSKMRRFRMDLQNAWYFAGLLTSEAKRQISDRLGYSVENYTVGDAGWIVESSVEPGKSPRIFWMTKTLMDQAFFGTEDRKGMNEILVRYEFHSQKGFDKDIGEPQHNLIWEGIEELENPRNENTDREHSDEPDIQVSASGNEGVWP
jgi:hypothetical protein